MFDIFYIHNPIKNGPVGRRVNTIEEARIKSRTRHCWVVDGLNDYTDFDWLWEPAPWEARQDHVWPSQHQQHGGTTLVTKDWNGDTNYSHPVVQRSSASSIVYLDMGNTSAEDQLAELTERYSVSKTRFIHNYLGTIRRVISQTNEPYIWLISSVCDYFADDEGFDFTWHPSEWQADMLHVFASSEQKFGDTFFVPVQKFKDNPPELLEWFETLCFHDEGVPRLTPPVVMTTQDSMVNAIKKVSFKGPAVILTTVPGVYAFEQNFPAMNYWRPETRAVMPLSKSGSTIIVPRDALNDIETQVYDYPVLDKSFNTTYEDKPLDVVFLSNGETNAEENYEQLVSVLPEGHVLHRVSGVNGRVAAYQACAAIAETDWFFIVWGKLKVSSQFDWNWQPDRMQARKHYIFYARNPVNDLIYGHMGMAAYNKILTMQNKGEGLDFIMSQPNETVPVLSGTAEYANDEWMAWRTAFREVIKLQHFVKEGTDKNARDRLNRWISTGHGKYGAWSIQGAHDAMDYYHEVGGNMSNLSKSYDWAWLRERFDAQYPQCTQLPHPLVQDKMEEKC